MLGLDDLPKRWMIVSQVNKGTRPSRAKAGIQIVVEAEPGIESCCALASTDYRAVINGGGVV